MSNNPSSIYYIKNQNDNQEQIKHIINYINKMFQEQMMSNQFQMNKIQFQMNNQMQNIREDYQNKIKLVNNVLTSTKKELKKVYNEIEKINFSYDQRIKEVKNNMINLQLCFELNVSTEEKYITLINKIIEIMK